MKKKRKFLLVGFDGLRPDMVTDTLMPNLCQFSVGGVQFTNHRCVFPSETYVNTASLVTGTFPSKHGIVANFFNDPSVAKNYRFVGYSVESIEKAWAAYNGRLFHASSFGEILGDAGCRMAVISTNSAGSVRLTHHQVEAYSHLSLSCHSPATSYPKNEIRHITDRFGLLEEKEIPDLKGVTYATDVFLNHVADGEMPDLTILWYGEPDNSYHCFGIGSTESIQALKHTDSEFGRVFNWWSTVGKSQSIDMIVASDHAHITQDRKVCLKTLLEESGFSVGDHLEEGTDVALLPGYSGNLCVRNGEQTLLSDVAKALMELDCMGLIFTRNGNDIEGSVSGTFSMNLVMTEHERAPDMAFVLSSDDQLNDFGYKGTCYFDNVVPLGGGIHGGLHPAELHCVLTASGELFLEDCKIETPSGIVDILPTILYGLDVPPPEPIAGRILHEAMAHDADTESAGETEIEVFETGDGSYQQRLRRIKVGKQTYIHSGERI